MNTEVEKFSPLQTEVATLVAPTLKMTVSDFKTSEAAIQACQQIKELSKRLDKRRRELVDPLNAEVKAINEIAKQVGGPLDAAEAHLRLQLNRFAAEQEKKRQEEFARIETERKQREAELAAKQEDERKKLERGAALFGTGGEEVAQLEEKHQIETAIARTEVEQARFDANQQQIKNTRRTLKCKAVDLTKVPREFLIVELNEKAVCAAYKGGVTVIPGVEFWHEVGVAIGEKTRVPRAALG